MYTLEFQTLLIFVAPVWIVFRIIKILVSNKHQKTISIKKEIIINLFFIYVMGVIKEVAFPLHIGHTKQFYMRGINLIPFKSIEQLIRDGFDKPFVVRNVLGNIILFCPLGFFVPLLWKSFNSNKKTIFLGFAVSVLIESSQFFLLVNRSVDIDDVILNVLGTILGVIIYRVSSMLKNSNPQTQIS